MRIDQWVAWGLNRLSIISLKLYKTIIIIQRKPLSYVKYVAVKYIRYTYLPIGILNNIVQFELCKLGTPEASREFDEMVFL